MRKKRIKPNKNASKFRAGWDTAFVVQSSNWEEFKNWINKWIWQRNKK